MRSHRWVFLLYLAIQSAVVLLAGELSLAQMSPAVDAESAERIFAQNVHPFLRVNCAECHDENAGYPAGPIHSATVSKDAFLTFRRFVDWDSPSQSKIVAEAKGGHYCNRFRYNCAKIQQIGEGLDALMNDYIRDVRTASATKIAASPALAAVTSAETPNQSAIQSPSPLMATRPFISEETVFSPSTIFSTGKMKFVLDRAFPGTTGASLVIYISPYKNNFYKLEKIYFEAKMGTFSIFHPRVQINGRETEFKTGIESLERVVYFGENYSQTGKEPYGTQLSLGPAIVEIKPGDKVSLSFESLNQLVSTPSGICEFSDDERYAGIFMRGEQIMPRSNGLYSEFVEFKFLKRNSITRSKHVCMMIESRINRLNPRRSALLAMTNSDAEKINVLTFINDWLQLVPFSR